MRSLITFVAAVALFACAAGCNIARVGFNTAQAELAESRVYIATDGAFKQNANAQYAYIDGVGKYRVGLLYANAALDKQASGEGAIRKAWRVYWPSDSKLPVLVEVPFEVAYGILGDPPPTRSPPVVDAGPSP